MNISYFKMKTIGSSLEQLIPKSRIISNLFYISEEVQ